MRRARDRRIDDVADREDAAPRALRLLDRGQRVGGLAALGDGDDQVAGADDRIAVAELARQIDLARDARRALDQELADQAGVVRGAAGEQHDPPQVLDVELEPVEVDVVRLEHQARRAACRRRRAAARGSP